MTTQSVQRIRGSLWRMIRWTAGDAAMGALCAALFGMIYGGFETLVYGNPWRIVLTAGYFSLAGGVAGAVLGAFGALIECIEGPSTASNASDAVHAKNTGLPSETRSAGSSVYQRPTAVGNPLIARWQFVENLAGNETRSPSNCTRLPPNGTVATPFGSHGQENVPHQSCEFTRRTGTRRSLQHIRAIGDEETND